MMEQPDIEATATRAAEAVENNEVSALLAIARHDVPALIAEIHRLEEMLFASTPKLKYARCGACNRVRALSEMSLNCHRSIYTCPEQPCADAFCPVEAVVA